MRSTDSGTETLLPASAKQAGFRVNGYLIERVHPWTEVAGAHRQRESGRTRGKLVLTVDRAGN